MCWCQFHFHSPIPSAVLPIPWGCTHSLLLAVEQGVWCGDAGEGEGEGSHLVSLSALFSLQGGRCSKAAHRRWHCPTSMLKRQTYNYKVRLASLTFPLLFLSAMGSEPSVLQGGTQTMLPSLVPSQASPQG